MDQTSAQQRRACCVQFAGKLEVAKAQEVLVVRRNWPVFAPRKLDKTGKTPGVFLAQCRVSVAHSFQGLPIKDGATNFESDSNTLATSAPNVIK